MTPLRIGLLGLGTIAEQIAHGLADTDGVVLAAAGDLRGEARAEFEDRWHAPAFATAEALCGFEGIDAVWGATPNPLHAAHAMLAARAGKHVICEKPLSVGVDEARALAEVVDAAGVALVVGHSRIHDAPIRAMQALIAAGAIGRVFQVDCWLFNDWLQRPRLATELDVAAGGGILFRQAPHLVDIARFLMGSRVTTVRAVAGAHDGHFATHGNFAALIGFADGGAATLSFNGYGFFDSAELTGGINGGGRQRSIEALRARHSRRTGVLDDEQKFGAAMATAPARSSASRYGASPPVFGLTIVSGSEGVLRQSPQGLLLYRADCVEDIVLPPPSPGVPEVALLREAISRAPADRHEIGWAAETVAVCEAMLRSASADREIVL